MKMRTGAAQRRARHGSAAARRGAWVVESGRVGGGAAAGPPARIEFRYRRRKK